MSLFRKGHFGLKSCGLRILAPSFPPDRWRAGRAGVKQKNKEIWGFSLHS